MEEKNFLKMTDIFAKCSITLNDTQLQQFAKFYDLLMMYNEEYDLTRLKTFNDIIIKHFVDSIFFKKFIDLPAKIIDIGSGAGFPGIPLKICDPNINIILAEPRFRRVKFMETVIAELGLTGIEIYPHQVTEKSYFEITGIITRAFESINNTLERVKHFLPENGVILFMKGPEVDKDLDEVNENNMQFYKLKKDLSYTLPSTSYHRRMLIFTKTKSTFNKKYHIFLNPSETIGSPITSSDNHTYKQMKKLIASDGIKKQGAALVSGKKIIAELLNNDSIKKESLIIFDGYSENDDFFNKVMMDYHNKKKLLILKKILFNELDIFNTNTPLLSIKIPSIPDWDEEFTEECTLMIPFQDPINVGSIIRNAAAFGVKKIILLKEAANPFHPKTIRASAGSVFNVELSNGPSIWDLHEKLNNINIVTLDPAGKSIYDTDLSNKFCLLPGLEGQGLPETLRKNSISIPLESNVESLNAATATSIALYEWQRRKKIKN
jgi:16S rRNA (guanine527-N7)-methyltransferase